MITNREKVRSGSIKIIALTIIGILIAIVVDYYILPYLIVPALKLLDPTIHASDLSNISKYVRYAIVALIIVSIAMGILHVIKNLIETRSSKSNGKNYRGLYTVIRAAIYGIAIAIFLGYIGVSLTGALIGGTVGGLIISFALQNTVSNLLSGLLLASAGVVKPKQNVSIFSWLFDNPVVGQIMDVKLLTAQIMTIDGTITELPNTALLGSTQFTDLDVGNVIRTSITVALPVDAQIHSIMEIAKKSMEAKKDQEGVLSVEQYFFTKNFNSNVIKVIFNCKRILNYNHITNMVNLAYEEAYWEMKNRAPQGNNIILGFPVDIPISDIITDGDLKLNTNMKAVGIKSFKSYFFIKSSAMNSIKVKFEMNEGADYDIVANTINSSYEGAYLSLKGKAAGKQ